MRAWAGLVVAAGLATQSGCKVFERWSKDRPLGQPASRTRDDDRDPTRPPKNWLDQNPLPGGRPAAVPSAATLGDPRDPNFDLRTEVKGMLAGIVVDPDGRGVPYLSIQIDLADPMQNGGAPVTADTDRNGYFLIRGLKPNQAYTLSAQAKQGGRVIAGQTVAKPPSPTVRIQLREDVALPSAGRGTDLPPDAGGASPAPPTNSIPGGVPSLFDAPATSQPSAPTPVPRSRENGALPYPSEGAPNDGAYSPVPPAATRPPGVPAPKTPAAPRSELVAPGPYPDKPPPASIPGPGTTTDGLIPPPALPPRTSRFNPRPSPGPFALTDPLGRTRQFPSGRAGELVLLDFMTTTCAPCRKAVPALAALQAKYGSAGLEVVGVTCDDAGEADRRSLAAKSVDELRLNYLVYAEPGSAPGKVMRHFGVTGFPTLVLIDGNGSILWQGHSAEMSELEGVVTATLRR